VSTDGDDAPATPGLRLQKLLAQSGVASRRACEGLIADGRVEVDGEVVTRLGARVDPETAVVRVDGRRVPVASAYVYLAVNKPRGVVSSMSDERGRPDLRTLVADRPERLFHVGRLDTDTDGLLILTNHGDFAHRLTHPSYELTKTYVATVAGTVRSQVRRQLLAGVSLADGPVTVDAFRVLSSNAGRSIVEVVIHEGRKHVVRRLLAEVGHPVQQLTRTAIGPVHLGTLRVGNVRPLISTELGSLLDLVGL
jgi:23S rRNA pseudouridine2605 synthase